MRRVRFSALAMTAIVAAAGCVHLHKTDSFPLPAKFIDLDVARDSLRGVGDVSELPVQAAGRAVHAYVLRVPNSRGVLIFYGGSGNDTFAQLRALAHPVAALGLDLVVFSYYVVGDSVPSSSEAKKVCHAVYAAASAIHGVPSTRTFVVGHSLGAWLALDVASSEPVAGLVLVGAGTKPPDIIRATIFLSHFVRIVPDSDQRQMDASLYAPKITSPTLVVTSRKDEAVPVALSKRVFAELPAGTERQFLVLQEPTHGRYFRDTGLWQATREFFHLPLAAPSPSP